MTALPPWMLDNTLRGADPAELDRCHSDVLDMLPLDPEPVDGTSLVDAVVDDERVSVAWIRAQRRPVTSASRLGPGPLSEHPDAAGRIERWMATGE